MCWNIVKTLKTKSYETTKQSLHPADSPPLHPHPVLFVTNPIPLNFAEFMDDMKKEYEADKAKGKGSKFERKVIERYEKLEQSRANVNINVVTPYSVKYSNVKVE